MEQVLTGTVHTLDATDIMFPTIGNVDSVSGPYVGPIRQIQLDVCEEYGISLNDLLSKRQRNHVNKARKTAMQRARATTRGSYPELGRAFDRHYTTVMAACNEKVRQ